MNHCLARMPQQPHILLIHSDQHRYDCLGVNGHPLLQTPVLDRLASEGVNFTHAFTPIPLCVPARNCLLHSQWATEHLCIANYDTEAPRPPPETLPSFSAVLRQNGYRLGYVGKWHVSRSRTPADYGFDTFVDENEYGKWRSAQGLPPIPHLNGWFGETDAAITPDQSGLAWGADRTIRLIENAGTDPRPFFIRWDPSEPHLPNVVPEPYASMYPPAAIPPWPSFPDPLDGKPYIQRQQRRTWKLDAWTWKDWAPIVGRYLGVISLMDAQIGRILACLDRLGIADNTLVVYTTDHGDMCGGHGMIDKHFVMYDDVVRVPLILRWPGRIEPGTVCRDFVSHALDLATTFCRAAGVESPSTFRGGDLLSLLNGTAEPRCDIFSTYHGNQFGLYSQRMVRDRDWKYVWNATAEDELYDLSADPAERHNRAADPICLPPLRQLRGRLLAWMEQTKDPLLNPWTRGQLAP
ncbi:MAG: sulfatase-like hydrolase/transferase [Lentisphaerae bacterium]|nr:sulfatase-like hydrolase/transferase [Lentisphaerota bacterium]